MTMVFAGFPPLAAAPMARISGGGDMNVTLARGACGEASSHAPYRDWRPRRHSHEGEDCVPPADFRRRAYDDYPPRARIDDRLDDYPPPRRRDERADPPPPYCDAGCWFRRMKAGYCGHGCEYYRYRKRY
jgi:hypothetical protein